jgi:hypothetical protein
MKSIFKAGVQRRTKGLTILELLIVVATLALLIGLLMPAGKGCKQRPAQITRCMNNLKQMALAEIVWAYDQGFDFPVQPSTNIAGFSHLLLEGGLARHYQLLSNELVSPVILACPSDDRRPAGSFAQLTTNHVSYFLNLDPATNRNSAIHGDRKLEFNPPRHGSVMTLSSGTSIRWSANIHGKQSLPDGNLSYIDGSVSRVGNPRELEDALLGGKEAGSRLFFP